MKLNSKKKIRVKLLESFGKIKDDSFNFELIEKYFKKKEHKKNSNILSDKTCNDMDFQELFMIIDRTNSKIGQQYLYNTLRNIPNKIEKDKLHRKETIIHQFDTDPERRVDIQSQLSQLGNDEAYHITSLFQDELMKAPKWFFIFRLLSFTSILSIIMIPFNPQILFALLIVFIINLILHYLNKKNVNEYLSSIPQLLKLNFVAKDLYRYDFLKNLDSSLRKSTEVIDKVRNRMSFFQLEAKLTGEFGAFFWAILELFKILFLIEPLVLFGVLKRLDSKRREIEEVFSFVGQVDTLISIASLRYGLDKYCIPEISTDKKTFVAKEMYHPLIPECVANSIHADKKSILLTGSNMSGKTTFIRAMGVNTITALALNTAFAEYFSLPVLRIMSAIRISDDLMNDKSYYFEEVQTIKEMIDESNSEITNLLLLDEIFKGTNTVERISAGKAVLSELTKKNIVFVSTHDIELADLLKTEYELYHFSEKVDDKTVDFDFKLKEGKLKNRNAIKILQINGYPESVVEEAMEISKELDQISVNKLKV